MPELPEVEAARAAIAEHCIGKTIIKSIIANDSKVINGVSPSLFQASILNKTIIAAHRKGKNMWLQLDSPPFPSFQFGMAGAVYIKGVAVTKYKRSAVNDTDEWPSKYSMFFVELNDGLEISFTDKRRFATVRLLEDPTAVLPISALGPDALLEPMTEVEFFSSLNKKKIAIKALLLDQSFISGIGNWIADEVLYQARIHPSQGASSLSKDESARLLKCIKEVLEKAVEVGADSTQYPCNWIYHSRDMKPGKAFVDGKKIDFIKVGGRTTAYVPEFQKLNGEQATEAPPNPRKKASGKNNNDDYGNDDEDGMEEERESAKSEKAKNKRSGNQSSKGKKSTKNNDNVGDDEKIEKDITGLGNGKATAKRKSLGMEESKNLNKSKKSRGGRKKATSEAKLENNNDSDNDEDGSGSEDQKKPTRAKPQKPQKQTKKKAK